MLVVAGQRAVADRSVSKRVLSRSARRNSRANRTKMCATRNTACQKSFAGWRVTSTAVVRDGGDGGELRKITPGCGFVVHARRTGAVRPCRDRRERRAGDESEVTGRGDVSYVSGLCLTTAARFIATAGCNFVSPRRN